MSNQLNFTQDRIAALPVPAIGRVDYYDLKQPKLTCRVSASGSRSFVVLKKLATGKTGRVTLGRFPDISVNQARTLAADALHSIARGINPTEEKRAARVAGLTLAELLDVYLTDRKDLSLNSVRTYRQRINYTFADWLHKPVKDITRDMVKVRRNKLTGNTDNPMKALRILMRYAVKPLRVISESPVEVLTEGKLWIAPTRKDRIIPAGQCACWYRSVLALRNRKVVAYLMTLLYTGLRDSEARNLLWSDVDLNAGTLVARRTKNKLDFTAYVAPQLKPYLIELWTLSGHTPYLFPGNGSGGVIFVPKSQLAGLIKTTGITFSPHDLRRTFLTYGEAAGVPYGLLQRLANHTIKPGDVTAGYIRGVVKSQSG